MSTDSTGGTYDKFDSDTAPYRKRSQKSPPKKSDHRHIYEPVILEWWNPELKFDRERGFVGGTDRHPGSRCSVCGKLTMDFPKGSKEYDAYFAHRGSPFSRREVMAGEEFGHLEVCKVENIWNL